jgi:hypothetical protein
VTDTIRCRFSSVAPPPGRHTAFRRRRTGSHRYVCLRDCGPLGHSNAPVGPQSRPPFGQYSGVIEFGEATITLAVSRKANVAELALIEVGKRP